MPYLFLFLYLLFLSHSLPFSFFLSASLPSGLQQSQPWFSVWWGVASSFVVGDICGFIFASGWLRVLVLQGLEVNHTHVCAGPQ